MSDDKARFDKKLVYGLKEHKWPTSQQLKYLPEVLTVTEKKVVKILIFVVIACILVGVSCFYFNNTEKVPKAGGEYTEALVGSPQYVNPVLAPINDTDMDISRLVFSGLMKYDENQELVSDLITNYGLTDDEETYTFYLRKDVKWHDGEDLTSDDILFTIAIIQDQDYKSPLYDSLRGVTAEKIDDHAFKLGLEEPFTPFLSSLTFGILPEHIWFDIPPANVSLAEYNLKPIGNGPYQFESLVKDKAGYIKTYNLVRNEDYYNNKPYIEKISFRFYPDIQSAVDATRNKNVEGVSFIPKDSKEDLEKNKDLAFYNLRLPQYTAVFFNQKNKLLKEKEVREALTWSVDREKIVNEVLNSEGEIIHSPILEGYLGYNPEVFKYSYDMEKARKILDDAGWALLEGETVRKKDGAELAFAVTTVDLPEYLQTIEIIKSSWEELGVRVDVKNYSAEDIQQDIIKPRDYEALLFGVIVGNDPDPYPFWHSSQSKSPGLNLSGIYNKDADQLLEEARKTSDEEQRRMKYIHFQNILVEEALPAIFLYNPLYTYVVSKKVKGIGSQYITVPSDRFIGVEEWYIKTDRRWK